MHGPGLCHSRQGKRIAGCNLKARAMGCEPTQFALVKLESFLSYHLAVVRGWWSASSFSQQLFSASSFLSAAFLKGLVAGGQLAAFLSSFSQLAASQQLSLSSFSQQPSSAIILLWSGAGGQLATILSSHPQLSSCCGQGLVVS